MNKLKLEKLLRQYFDEDIGYGDLTSEIVFSNNETVSGSFIAKNEGVIAGLDIIRKGYELMDRDISTEFHVRDGDYVKKNTNLASVHGPVASLLTGERVILNLMQRMSGIATLTHTAVHILNSNHTRICDTRKTMPGLGMLDKYAVRCGGGYNHRFGLYDGVMIKDNHIAYLGSIEKAVHTAKKQLGHMVKVEVETETLAEVLEAVEAGADIIMFDNRTPEEVREFIKHVPATIVTEASGGITFENLAGYCDTKVDYLSLGMLTHSVPAFDISFNLQGGVKS